MPITIAQIQALTYLSNANFKKRECEFCKHEFYSIRDAKYCCSACKQSAYRMRLLNDETQPEEKPPEKKSGVLSSSDSKIILELKKKMKLYDEKLKQLNLNQNKI